MHSRSRVAVFDLQFFALRVRVRPRFLPAFWRWQSIQKLDLWVRLVEFTCLRLFQMGLIVWNSGGNNLGYIYLSVKLVENRPFLPVPFLSLPDSLNRLLRCSSSDTTPMRVYKRYNVWPSFYVDRYIDVNQTTSARKVQIIHLRCSVFRLQVNSYIKFEV